MSAEPELIMPCCGYVVTDPKDRVGPIMWNPYNKAVQCHNCGQSFAQVPAPERRKEQGHEPWPGTPGAQNEDSARMLQWVRDNCKVIYWPAPEAYPIEHAPHAGKDSWQMILDAARGVQPAAQEGAPAAETFPHGMGNTIRRARTASEIATAKEAARRCTALVLKYEEAGWDRSVPVILEAMDTARQDWPLALTQSSVEELQRQLAQAVNRNNWLENTLEPELRQQLESAQAACKAKDEALADVELNGYTSPELVAKALAITPNATF